MKDVTVIYLRLSKEDDSMKDESNSISNQRILLRKFIAEDEKLKSTEVVEIVDDGYTGKIIERPGMNRLLDMIRRQQINNIIVKDFSRFSRDYLTLGKYVEQIFPFMGIRFIAVNDNYDSSRSKGGICEVDASVKAMLYDFYSEDLSIKVKSSLKMKRDSGKYIAPFAPYGYRKSDEDKYKLVIDEYASEIVKRIFREYLDGQSMYAIANALNADGVLCPAKYIQMRDDTRRNMELWKDSLWTNVSVGRILKSEVYLGAIVSGRTVDAEPGRKATVNKPREEWRVIDNTHEPIIDRKSFDEVQKKMSRNKKPTGTKAKTALSGLVVCGGCGYRMQFSGKGRPKYTCYHKYRIADDSKAAECAVNIRVEDLEEIVLSKLSEQLSRLEDERAIIEKERAKQCAHEREARNRLSSLAGTIEKLSADQMNAYESYREGNIDRDTYLQQKNMYEEMLVKLRDNMSRQEEAVVKIAEETSSSFTWFDDNNHMALNKLDRNLAHTLIDRIVIGSRGEIEIVWKFKNE